MNHIHFHIHFWPVWNLIPVIPAVLVNLPILLLQSPNLLFLLSQLRSRQYPQCHQHSFQRRSLKIVRISHQFEPFYPSDRLSIHKAHQAGQHTDSKLLDQKRRILYVNSDNTSFVMLRREGFKMTIEDGASVKVRMEEMDHGVLRLSKPQMWLVSYRSNSPGTLKDRRKTNAEISIASFSSLISSYVPCCKLFKYFALRTLYSRARNPGHRPSAFPPRCSRLIPA